MDDEIMKKLGIEGDAEYRIDPETGVVQKLVRGVLGPRWEDTDTRVDPETGKVQYRVRGLFGWRWEDKDP
jgi:hypothetical protein